MNLVSLVLGLLVPLVAWSQTPAPPGAPEPHVPYVITTYGLGEFSGQGSWMGLRESKPGLKFTVYGQDQSACGDVLPGLAKGAVRYTLAHEDVNVRFYRFDVLCRRESDGRFFVVSIPNVGVSSAGGGLFCLYAHRVGSDGFSGSVEPVSALTYCSPGGGEKYRFTLLVKAGRVAGVLFQYESMGAHPPFSPYFEALFVDPAAKPSSGQQLLLQVVSGEDDVVAYAINEDRSLARRYGIVDLQRKRGQPRFQYGHVPFVLHRLWGKDELLSYQVLDTTEASLGSPVPRDPGLRRDFLLQHLTELMRRLRQETSPQRGQE